LYGIIPNLQIPSYLSDLIGSKLDFGIV